MSTKSAMYLTALMQCLLTRLLMIKTPQGSDVKRLSKEPIASLSFENLKLEVENAKRQLVATDSRPVMSKSRPITAASDFSDPLHLAWSLTEPGTSDNESA